MKAAIRFLRSKAEDYRLDTDRITAGGFSAGAITSLILAYADDYGEGESGNPGFPSNINGVYSIAGSLDSDYLANIGTPEHQQPVILLHGTKDSKISYAKS